MSIHPTSGPFRPRSRRRRETSHRARRLHASASRTILIVEDDAHARLALEALVSSYGYTVKSAANGTETLNVAAASEFEGVLLDLLQPDMNGLEVLKQIRLLHPTVPILILSGYDQFKAQALASGAQGFLSKPFDTKRLRGSHAGLVWSALTAPQDTCP